MARPTVRVVLAAIPRLAAAVMLVLAVGSWSRDFYVLLRWLVFGAGGLVVVLSWRSARFAWVWIMIMICVLFNPLSEIHLSRSTWLVIDPAVAFVFVVSLFVVRTGPQRHTESVG